MKYTKQEILKITKNKRLFTQTIFMDKIDYIAKKESY